MTRETSRITWPNTTKLILHLDERSLRQVKLNWDNANSNRDQAAGGVRASGRIQSRVKVVRDSEVLSTARKLGGLGSRREEMAYDIHRQ
ncbi:hypothetical protein EVAR_36878_1 [Eumeta japonica]|uniref:Uncharacterized protein n=1 Tax=Eumeta variegata TaxID=151549 RepID=A0A4C1WV69_EUMVA|nr:hypothetical protein EVAR_36878_1 [Eumeta japonica]